jgi:outer membrane protein OmpA-like peptidoglycan-associated protein
MEGILTQSSQLAAKRVAQSLVDKKYNSVKVLGYAPDHGEETLDKALSAARARAIAVELINNGIDKNKIRLGAFGSKNPHFPDTPEGRIKNQRVEIIIE